MLLVQTSKRLTPCKPRQGYGGPPSILMILVTATMIVKVPIAQVSHIWSLTVFHLLDFIIKNGDGPAYLTSVGSAHGSNV